MRENVSYHAPKTHDLLITHFSMEFIAFFFTQKLHKHN